ncbi:hypothetical protein FISHEDRAFT_38360, partial [Fistulina hepatica ATCC 64428]
RKSYVRASAAIPAHGRMKEQPGYQDFALVRTGERNLRTEGGSLEGLRVARVRVLFMLPDFFGVSTANNVLAYVEWFTPFASPDPVSGLCSVKPSTRQRHAYGEIIDVARIVRNCILIPSYGHHKKPSWTSATVLEECRVFFVALNSDLHMFALLKMGKAVHKVSPRAVGPPAAALCVL